MFPRLLILAVVMSSLAVGARAEAAKVVGKVAVTEQFRRALADEDAKAPTAAKPGYWNEPNAVRDVEPPYVAPGSDLGIVLVHEGAPAPKADDPVEVDVRAGGLARNVVVVRPGATVKFRSVDPFDHELYVPDYDDFKPEKQSRGSFRTIGFAKEGVYEVRCRLMPHFRGWIVVTNATFVLPADGGGAFSQDGLAVGDYTLRVFFRGRWIHEQKLKIENERGDVPVEVKLDKAPAPGQPPAAPAKAPEAPAKKPTGR
jgi:plastocyanin